jgi:hypothetical protein
MSVRAEPRSEPFERPIAAPSIAPLPHPGTAHRSRSIVAGALLAALLSSIAVVVITQLWDQSLHVPFQYTHAPGDDQQDATLDLMLIKNMHETGWFDTNPRLNAPFSQHWAEWPMGGDLLAYVMKKGIVDATGDVALTFNVFWLLTFPLTALVAFPVLRALRCSWTAALVGAVAFSLAPYHFRNGAAHENLAFYVGVPVIVLACMRVLGPDHALPRVGELRHRRAWRRLGWLLAGAVLVGVTGIYYLAFLLTLLAVCAVISAIAFRRPGRLVVAALIGGAGLVASFLANLPTLLYRWQHAPNLLGVPDRVVGAAEEYPLRVVELLSPVTAHRFGPFSAIADRLYEPGREGLGTAELGAFAAIGFVVAIVALIVRALRRTHNDGWSYEARLGVVMLAALAVATKGGLSRPLEYLGLQGVRAWNRIAIVVAFAGIVVAARLLDRVRVRAFRSRNARRPVRYLWCAALAGVVVLTALDQASPAFLPKTSTTARAWNADAAFVTTLQRRLPENAMVFQLPVVDFPEHGTTERMSNYDLIKEGYLHSTRLRWSAGGVRGRDGEWQFPAAALPPRQLLRGIAAIGFSAVMLDRYGYHGDATDELRTFDALLGRPIARRGDRLVAWDLRPAATSLLRGLSPAGRHALARRTLDAPRLYLSTDADRLLDRGGRHPICRSATVTLVNPGPRRVERELSVRLHQRVSAVRAGRVTVDGRPTPVAADGQPHRFDIDLAPGTTTVHIGVDRPGARCAATPVDTLASMSATLHGER